MEMPQTAFNANLVDEIDDVDLMVISKEILAGIDSDKESRADWEKTYVDGLKYLGMKFDEARSSPFQGSTGVIHPILAEAVTQFQAQAYKEMLPQRGPVKTEVVGARTPESDAQASRVEEFMNFYILNVMQEFDPELDMLLFYLPLAGSAFKKYTLTRQSIVPCQNSSSRKILLFLTKHPTFSIAERVTHVLQMSKNEIRKQQLNGFYADINISDGGYAFSRSEIEEEIDSIEGMEPSSKNTRDHTVYEVHTVLDLPG